MIERVGDILGDWLSALEAAKQAQEEFERNNPDASQRIRRAERRRTRDWQLRRLESYKIPPALSEEITDHNYPQMDIEVEIRKKFADGKRIIVVCGLIGSGKTIAACRWLSDEWRGIYVKAFDYCALTDHLDKDRDSVAFVKGIDSLVLDELAMEQDRDRYKIEQLLHHRIDGSMLRTVVIINRNAQETYEYLGQRITSRIYEVGWVITAKTVVRRGELIRQKRQRSK